MSESEIDRPPWTAFVRRMTESRATIAEMTKDAFSDRGEVSRAEFLRLFRTRQRIEDFRAMIAAAARDDPGATGAEAVAVVRAWLVEFFDGIAAEAGLGRWEWAALTAAVHKGFALATHGQGGDHGE